MAERFRTARGQLELNRIAIGQILNQELVSRFLKKVNPRHLTQGLIDNGFRTFDTADSYGVRNDFLGRSLRKTPRNDFEIISKVYFPYSKDPKKKGLSEYNIKSSFEHSARSLNLDYLDLLLAHRFDEITPIEETVRTMSRLVSSGKIRAWGVSEWNSTQIENLIKLCDDQNYTKPVLIQSQASLLWRTSLKNVIDVCQENQITFMAWSPMAQGLLTGKYERFKRSSKNFRINQNPTPFLNYFLSTEVIDRLSAYKNKMGLSSEEMAQIALEWLFFKGVDSVVTNYNRGMTNRQVLNSDTIKDLDELTAPYAIQDSSYIGKDSP